MTQAVISLRIERFREFDQNCCVKSAVKYKTQQGISKKGSANDNPCVCSVKKYPFLKSLVKSLIANMFYFGI